MAYYQGKLYIGGGQPSSGCRQDFYAYDIAMNTWTTLPNHPTTHFDGWAVAYNGKIYVTGEHHPGCNTCTNQYYYYNIASNAWSPMPVFPGGPRNNLQLVELNGVLYGGWGNSGDFATSHLHPRLVGILPVMGEDRTGALGRTSLRSA
jgi:N-acetylneuraminic acid mutarotase